MTEERFAPNRFKLGERVRVIKPHRYRGGSAGALKTDLIAVVTDVSAKPEHRHRFQATDVAHVVLDNQQWIEEDCLDYVDSPSAEEVALAVASITGGQMIKIKHCPTCTCEES